MEYQQVIESSVNLLGLQRSRDYLLALPLSFSNPIISIGISTNTIQEIYEQLIQQQVISIDFNYFMSSQVELIDLTKDLQTDDIALAFDQIKSRIKPRNQIQSYKW